MAKKKKTLKHDYAAGQTGYFYGLRVNVEVTDKTGDEQCKECALFVQPKNDASKDNRCERVACQAADRRDKRNIVMKLAPLTTNESTRFPAPTQFLQLNTSKRTNKSRLK